MADDAATPSGEVSESASEAEVTATEETLETPEDVAAEDFDEAVAEETAEPGMSHLKLATIVGLVVVLALAVIGLLGLMSRRRRKN